MRPKCWIAPELDKPLDGELRIVKLADGSVRATKWRQWDGSTHGYYADSKGDGVCSSFNPVVAVGAK